jgi:hypothetical protein
VKRTLWIISALCEYVHNSAPVTGEDAYDKEMGCRWRSGLRAR